ncbi:hypothetical protein FJ656_35840 [Schumannella luteola]|uniref:Uncharacterized protein n=1 Tax=Schumannella luteola TaxID=472059 RepID=A0A852Y6D1_9MICO|nr:hypothetical protein [Schumannella luteola]NYG97853.1 hypothetical protein [Schumannella luteola]TPW91464.1 hypothetical protein FJ656_35840 [Schumannella luteola]
MLFSVIVVSLLPGVGAGSVWCAADLDSATRATGLRRIHRKKKNAISDCEKKAAVAGSRHDLDDEFIDAR